MTRTKLFKTNKKDGTKLNNMDKTKHKRRETNKQTKKDGTQQNSTKKTKHNHNQNKNKTNKLTKTHRGTCLL